MPNPIQLPPLSQLQALVLSAGQCLVSPNGKELYVSSPDRNIVLFTGPDFNKMKDEEISRYIILQVNLHRLR